ncbi:MAG: hypothetical protein KDA32_04975 [Phycisphaerales bacterium]|nr:hypothetical protein [Phycisphaerales bacterium]
MKIGIIVVVLLAAVGYYAYTGGGAKPQLSQAPISFVDVATGEIFQLERDDFVSIPAKNPKTDTYTLMPIEKVDDAWYVKDRYRGGLTQTDLENVCVDPETLKVKAGGDEQ